MISFGRVYNILPGVKNRLQELSVTSMTKVKTRSVWEDRAWPAGLVIVQIWSSDHWPNMVIMVVASGAGQQQHNNSEKYRNFVQG